ncbi:MAG: hypothetical protein JNM12_10065 [Alphaproteobacteria bacterium]|nr:hypothetical protein [Alphaproteobacteria bacterium]
MTQDTIRDTTTGPVSAMPSIEDLLAKMGGGTGWDALLKAPAAKELDESLKQKNEELQHDYFITFSTPHGRRVLQDILDNSIRRPNVHPAGTLTLEQQVGFSIERNGQNTLAYYICRKSAAGEKQTATRKNKKKA